MFMLYQLLKSINQFIKAKLYRFVRSYYIGFKKILGSEHFIVLRPKAKPGTNQVHLDMHYHGIEEPTCIIYLKGAAQGLEANVSGNSAMGILQGGANDPDPTNN